MQPLRRTLYAIIDANLFTKVTPSSHALPISVVVCADGMTGVREHLSHITDPEDKALSWDEILRRLQPGHVIARLTTLWDIKPEQAEPLTIVISNNALPNMDPTVTIQGRAVLDEKATLRSEESYPDRDSIETTDRSAFKLTRITEDPDKQ